MFYFGSASAHEQWATWKEVKPPIGRACARCGIPIQDWDSGFVLVRDYGKELVVYHQSCLLDSLMPEEDLIGRIREELGDETTK